jgi:proline iminopeptidase
MVHEVLTGWEAANMSSPPSLLSAGKHTATLNGLNIQYVVLSEAPNQPVALIHPPQWGIGAEFYIKAFAKLAGRFTVVIPSPRASDDSQPPEDPLAMTVRDVADDLEALRLHLGLDAFPVLAGHSGGGLVAMDYAIRFPSRVRRLVLMASALGGYRSRNTEFMGRIMQDWFGGGVVVDTDEKFKAFLRKWMEGYFYPSEKVAGYLEFFEEGWEELPRIWAWKAIMALEGGAKTVGDDGQLPRRTQREDLDKIEAKTLVVVGRQDPMCALDISEAIVEGVRDSKLVVLEECGHFLWMEQTEKFWDVFEEFTDGR